MKSSNFEKPEIPWRWRWLAWRNRVLASPGFQRFAASFVLTRPIARRRARVLFDLVAGFTYSQILAACIQTGLLEVLADGPHDIATIAPRIIIPSPIGGGTKVEKTTSGCCFLTFEGWGLAWESLPGCAPLPASPL